MNTPNVIDFNKIDKIKTKIKERNSIIPKHLAYLRKKNDMSFNTLAQLTELSIPYLCIIEKGKQIPSIEALVKLHEIYDVSVDFLTGRSDVAEKYTRSQDKCEHFTDLRHSKGFKQVEIANILGYRSIAPVYRQEKNGISMKLDRLEILADYFNVPLDYILGLTDITTIQ